MPDVATRQSSRALTIHAALSRLHLIEGSGVLHIHLVGADSREGSDVNQTAEMFLPLCELLAGTKWSEVSLLLCGPNCFANQSKADGTVVGANRPNNPALRVRYSSLSYEDFLASDEASMPHLAVAFNAGVWGYDSWRPCIERICQDESCSLLITSYNAMEADDDDEALRSYGVHRFLWEPQANPWGSPEAEAKERTRPTQGAPHAQYENAYWICISGPLSAVDKEAQPEQQPEPSLMMGKEEALARGFSADEEVIMPLPNWDNSSDEDSDEQNDDGDGGGQSGERKAAAQVAGKSGTSKNGGAADTDPSLRSTNGAGRTGAASTANRAPPPPPSAEHIERVLFGDPAHAHSERDMWSSAYLQWLHDESSSLPTRRQLRRVALDTLLRPGAFEEQHAEPMLITGVPQHEGWPAAQVWSQEESFVQSALGKQLELPITELFALHGYGKPQKLSLPLAVYREYAATNNVDFPYYPWERSFDTPAGHDLLNQWWPPSFFSIDHDVFAHSTVARQSFPYSCHRFVIIGGPRTGAVAHQDPKASAAWNTCLCGSKRWLFLPPSVTEEQLKVAVAGKGNANATDGAGKRGKGTDAGSNAKEGRPEAAKEEEEDDDDDWKGEDDEEEEHDDEDYRRVPPAYWWNDAYPRLAASGLPMIEVIQRAGETVYVPPLWWHAVLNLPHMPEESLSVCVTQNLLTPAMLLDSRISATWPMLRRSIGADEAYSFAREMHARRPGLLAQLLETCEAGSEEAAELQSILDGSPSVMMPIDDGDGDGRSDDETEAAHQSRPKAFVDEVKRRAAAARAHRVSLAAVVPPPAAAPPPVDVLDATAVSIADFRRRYVRAGEPAVLVGLADVLAAPHDDDPSPSSGGGLNPSAKPFEPLPASTVHAYAQPATAGMLRAAALAAKRDAAQQAARKLALGTRCGGLDRDGWLDWLESMCGNKRVDVLRGGGTPDQQPAVASSAGATTSKSGTLTSSVVLLGDLISKLRAGTAEGMYLYDLSLHKRLPDVLHHLRLPRHFAHCHLKRTRHAHAFSKAWPTLFLGARGTRSTLHVDQWHGHFWMYCLFGCKRWTFFHPDDLPLLYPDWTHGGLHPKFPSLYELQAQPERYPLFARARRREVIVHPGEVLFVPGGTPHAVENLTDSLAVAGNFVDESNLEAVLADMGWMGECDPALKEAASALAEMEHEEAELDALVGLEQPMPAEQLVRPFGSDEVDVA